MYALNDEINDVLKILEFEFHGTLKNSCEDRIKLRLSAKEEVEFINY